MNDDGPPTTATFDHYADDYDSVLEAGLAISGETKAHFARRRLAWLKQSLDRLGQHPQSVLDFGCGTGSAAPLILELLAPEMVVGVDISPKSIAAARRDYGSTQTQFHLLQDLSPATQFDLAFCNGVFHHIPRDQRAEAVSCVVRALRPGGLFAFNENNPWNPGTRYVMSRVAFDRHAVMLSAGSARALLRRGGLEIVRTDFLFIFPRWLAWMRPLEPWLCSWPMGAQYQVLCRKA